MKLDLYYYDECPFCQMVLRTVQSLGINDKITMKNTLRDRSNAQELMSLNGRTQVPCLIIDGKPMLESSDINNFLQTKFG